VTQDLSAQISAFVNTYIVPFGWKLLGALAVWIVGGWIVRVVRAWAVRSRQVDTTHPVSGCECQRPDESWSHRRTQRHRQRPPRLPL
jgi:hypothetical protein